MTCMEFLLSILDKIFTIGLALGGVWFGWWLHERDAGKRQKRKHLDDFAEAIRSTLEEIRIEWDDSISKRTSEKYLDARHGLRDLAAHIERRQPEDWKQIELPWKVFYEGEGDQDGLYHFPPENYGSGSCPAVEKAEASVRLRHLLYIIEAL